MIPEPLENSVQKAWKSVQNRPDFHLSYSHRCEIWRLIDLVNRDSGNSSEMGRHARATLAIMCVEKAISIWEDVFPLDRMPHELCSSIRCYMSGQQSAKELQDRMGHAWTHGDNLAEQIASPAVYVIYAASQAASVALFDEHMAVSSDELHDDEIFDPYTQDCAYYIAAAVANGTPEEAASDPVLRRQFWEWYLHEAIPKACGYSD